MTDVQTALLILTLVVGFYAAWNIGANDVANAMGTSVGSGALTLRRAVILAGVFEFLGAYLVGANVSETVRKKMFDPGLFQVVYHDDAALVLGCAMIATLIAAGTWLLAASYFGWPVSTTHSVVGAVVGVGIAALGVDAIAWTKVGLITAGWVVSPLMSGTVAFFLFRWLLRRVFQKDDPLAAAKEVAPYLVFAVLVVLVGVATFKGFKPVWKSAGIDPFDARVVIGSGATALVLAGLGAYAAKRLVARIEPADGATASFESASDSPQLQKVERVFVFLQILTACFVAFAHGSNDVANAIGPMSVAYQAISTGTVTLSAGVPPWALALGGLGIVAGLATWGWRVIETVGKKITELTPSRGFAAEFAAAIVILAASVLPLGLPVSTTHTLVGAVLGVGAARGISALDLSVTRRIVASWFITIPMGAGIAVAVYHGLVAAVM